MLRQAVQGIADIITTPGLVNRDFSDIRAIMQGMGYAMMGTATAKGENAVIEAAKKAISCDLLEEGGVRGAKGILINITGTQHLGLHEVSEACNLIRDADENEDVQINFGVVLKEGSEQEAKITVIATGFERSNLPPVDRRAAATVTRVQPVSAPAPPVNIPIEASVHGVPIEKVHFKLQPERGVTQAGAGPDATDPGHGGALQGAQPDGPGAEHPRRHGLLALADGLLRGRRDAGGRCLQRRRAGGRALPGRAALRRDAGIRAPHPGCRGRGVAPVRCAHHRTIADAAADAGGRRDAAAAALKPGGAAVAPGCT